MVALLHLGHSVLAISDHREQYRPDDYAEDEPDHSVHIQRTSTRLFLTRFFAQYGLLHFGQTFGGVPVRVIHS